MSDDEQSRLRRVLELAPDDADAWLRYRASRRRMSNLELEDLKAQLLHRARRFYSTHLRTQRVSGLLLQCRAAASAAPNSAVAQRQLEHAEYLVEMVRGGYEYHYRSFARLRYRAEEIGFNWEPLLCEAGLTDVVRVDGNRKLRHYGHLYRDTERRRAVSNYRSIRFECVHRQEMGEMRVGGEEQFFRARTPPPGREGHPLTHAGGTLTADQHAYLMLGEMQQPCPRCSTAMRSWDMATVICPNCGGNLADLVMGATNNPPSV